jgi:hypothetical protein
VIDEVEQITEPKLSGATVNFAQFSSGAAGTRCLAAQTSRRS